MITCRNVSVFAAVRDGRPVHGGGVLQRVPGSLGAAGRTRGGQWQAPPMGAQSGGEERGGVLCSGNDGLVSDLY